MKEKQSAIIGKDKNAFSAEEKFCCLIFLCTLIFFGGYYEIVSAAVSIGFIVFLFLKQRRGEQLVYPHGLCFLALCLLPIFALITLFYAVDRGHAFLGVIKVLPLPVFALAIAQISREKRLRFLELIPAAAACMTTISLLCYFTPLREAVFQAGRLGGFFQYPNTFALFLLIAIIILCSKESLQRLERVMFLLCVAGILLTGSRSVFVLFVLYIFFVIITKSAIRKLVASLSLATVGAVFAVAYITGNVQSFARIATSFSANSTFWGRLLYYCDAISMLGKFPFGMGYGGYYFIQGTYQTGDYAVMFVHNELLQCALDFGILCGIIMAGAVLYSLFSKKLFSVQRVILLVCTIHSLWDFDYQFIAMGMILVLTLELGDERQIKRRKMVEGVLAAVVCVQLYGFIFLGLQAAGAGRVAAKIYPGLTLAQIEACQKSDDLSKREETADQILRRNKYCAAAYKVKAENAAAEGDFLSMEQYARKAIARDRYNEAAYEDYLRDISLALDYYIKVGEEKKVQEFLRYAAGTDDLMEQAEDAASPLAFKTRDDPSIELSDEYRNYLQQMKNLWEESEHESR